MRIRDAYKRLSQFDTCKRLLRIIMATGIHIMVELVETSRHLPHLNFFGNVLLITIIIPFS